MPPGSFKRTSIQIAKSRQQEPSTFCAATRHKSAAASLVWVPREVITSAPKLRRERGSSLWLCARRILYVTQLSTEHVYCYAFRRVSSRPLAAVILTGLADLQEPDPRFHTQGARNWALVFWPVVYCSIWPGSGKDVAHQYRIAFNVILFCNRLISISLSKVVTDSNYGG